MPTDILMPALSPTMEEGTLAKWHVKAGDKVKSGDVIAEIETDKATMEVEAVDEGTVEAILIPEGSEAVKINTPIARLGDGAPASASASKPPTPTKVEAPTPNSGEPPVAAAPLIPEASKAPAPMANGIRIAASPLARRLAAQLGVDLATIAGSGPHGRVVRRDLETLSPRPAAVSEAAPAQAVREALSLEQMGIAPGSYDLIPLDGMRKTVARRMTDSFRDDQHFPLTIDLDIDGLLVARGKINALLEKEGVKVSVNDMVILAAAHALGRVPEANASYTPQGLARHHHADIAVAVAIEGGLITPIIRAAETKGLKQIALEMKDLAERARTRKLKPEEFQGGTFSISNLGMFGIKAFASIVNEPQGAILSVGAGGQRAVVRGGQIVAATIMTVTLTCDHRVVDGAIGARWLNAFKAMIEDPVTMLA
jgi:pyruvate dehydrogenase E2 component (dihydrolipoamide acetyltransferase)